MPGIGADFVPVCFGIFVITGRSNVICGFILSDIVSKNAGFNPSKEIFNEYSKIFFRFLLRI